MNKYGSSAQKYIGDAVMALWVHRANGQEQLEILQVLRALTDYVQATAGLREHFRLPSELRVGAGLNTGLAAVGNPGTHQVMDFTALGDSLNVAFRMETATKELGTDVVLGKNTFEYLRSLPASTQDFDSAEVKVKGYDAPVQAWSTSFARLREILAKLDDDPNRTLESPV
jgi:adenylate cyclase